MSACTDKRERIIDAECLYSNGAYHMHRLPACLPNLFSLRFIAPSDYRQGQMIVVNGVEMTVKVMGGKLPKDDMFITGDVVHCDMDTVRKASYFQSGAAADKPTAMPVGTIMLLAHGKEELPDGWWFPSGEYFGLDSPVGRVLNSFSASYKANWGIDVVEDTIRLFDPDRFFANGHGRFLRPVDSDQRLPGSTEGDAIRKIEGELGINYSWFNPKMNHNGVFSTKGEGVTRGVAYQDGKDGVTVHFDSSLVVPTADENRPYNVGMTPAVYLGV